MNVRRPASAAVLFAPVLAAIAAAAACRTVPPAGTEDDGLRGRIEVDRFHVGPGETVLVADDVEIVAASCIVIEGELVARDREVGEEPADAPRIRLEAGDGILVTGAVRGGRGADRTGLDERGGTGSCITAVAPYVVLDGRLEAGEGGTSGPSMKGGSGGDVLIVGLARTRRPDGGGGYFGGRGGRGGAGDVGLGDEYGPGGDGGAGGSARVEPPRVEPTQSVEEFLEEALADAD